MKNIRHNQLHRLSVQTWETDEVGGKETEQPEKNKEDTGSNKNVH